MQVTFTLRRSMGFSTCMLPAQMQVTYFLVNQTLAWWHMLNATQRKLNTYITGKGYIHGRRAANVHLAIYTANCRGRPEPNLP